MLKILLLILKIFGIVLLSILCFILLLGLLVLFVPIRYKVKAKKENETWAKARIKWLFGIISIKCDYKEEKLTYSARVCGKLIVSDKPKKKNKKRNKPENKRKDKPKEYLIDKKDTIEELSKPHEPDVAKSESVIEEKIVVLDKTDSVVHKKKTRQNRLFSFLKKLKRIPDGLWKLIRKIKEKIKSLLTVVKGVFEKISKVKAFLKDQANRAGFKKAWMYLKRILKHIKPRKLVAKIKFGTGDPATTGQLLGLICAVYPPAINKLQLQPDFDEKRFEGELYARGRIRVFTLLVIAIKVIRDKDIKRMRKNVVKLKEEL